MEPQELKEWEKTRHFKGFMATVYQNWLTKWVIVLLITVSILVLILKFLDLTSIAFSLVLNFALMFCFTVAEAQLKPALSSSYFDAFPFEKQGKIYELLGVHGYRWLLKVSGWEKITQQANPVKKTIVALQQYERATRVSETGHALIATTVMGITVYVLVSYSALDAIWLILSNILLNVYPMLVQRYNRPRLRKAIKRLQAISTRFVV